MPTSITQPKTGNIPTSTPRLLTLYEVRQHFINLGLSVGAVLDVRGRIHTLDIRRRHSTCCIPLRTPVTYRLMGREETQTHTNLEHLFSLAVHDGKLDPAHVQAQVHRYAKGLPHLHPHTGRPDPSCTA